MRKISKSAGEMKAAGLVPGKGLPGVGRAGAPSGVLPERGAPQAPLGSETTPRTTDVSKLFRIFENLQRAALAALLLSTSACQCAQDTPSASPATPSKTDRAVAPPKPHRVDSRPPPLSQPVPLWEKGRASKNIDAATAAVEGFVVLDLGEAWTPYIFTERGSDAEPAIPHPYREIYLNLARGRFPDNYHGDRARRDKYLELYGIMPTLSLLRKRFEAVAALECIDDLDLEPVRTFEGVITFQGNPRTKRETDHYWVLKRQVERLMKRQRVARTEDLDTTSLDVHDQRRVHDYLEMRPKIEAIRAVQDRLECEGYFRGKGKFMPGGLDWVTHEALAEFERRHRVYGWGYIASGTLDVLRTPSLEAERQGVLRVLTERAMHAAGVIEDGSTSMKGDEPRVFRGRDGDAHSIPNLEAQIREAISEAFGLQTPDSTLEWLRRLDDVPQQQLVAFAGPQLPEYYDGDMPLHVVIDRGDIWYEFPFDEKGQPRPQPVQRRPKLTVFTEYLGQRIPLARYGTTVGGWRSELVSEEVMWRYKNSPTGPRVWHQIIAAPVWIPPNSAPPKEVLNRNPDRREDPRPYVVDYDTMGPSYASAYGLVAAYHLKYAETSNGLSLGADEGIRTHGSVDYMSIMRRHSHGCHRLHNHIAVRLMSFVLAHRPHRREGVERINYKREIEYEDEIYLVEHAQRGYVFQLERPVPVEVLEGRIRGRVKEPIEEPLPKFNDDLQAYILPDGGPVKISRAGQLTPTTLPLPDGGWVEALGLSSLFSTGSNEQPRQEPVTP